MEIPFSPLTRPELLAAAHLCQTTNGIFERRRASAEASRTVLEVVSTGWRKGGIIMPGLTIWKNQEINRMRRDLDRLFNRLWGDFGIQLYPRAAREAPTINLSETEDDLIIRAEIPGMDPEDLEILITDDILTIKGEVKQELTTESENYHRIERRYGTFSRSLQLPCKVMIDDVKATYEKGILDIVMPKCKPEMAREIKIKIK